MGRGSVAALAGLMYSARPGASISVIRSLLCLGDVHSTNDMYVAVTLLYINEARCDASC